MKHLKDLEALLRNANVQSPHSSDARRLAPRSFFLLVLPAINLRWLHQSSRFPQTPEIIFLQRSPYLNTFKDYLLCNLILRSTSGTPHMPCHQCESTALSCRGGHHAIVELQRARGQQQVAQELERNPPWTEWNWRGAEEWVTQQLLLPPPSELEWMNDKQRADENW